MLKFCYKIIVATAFTLTLLSTPTWAATSKKCDLSDGLAHGPSAFREEVESCVNESNASNLKQRIANSIHSYANNYRKQFGFSPLEQRSSIDKVAEAHVLDMIARQYASHKDLANRSHIQRIRLLDRTALIGASGANIAIVKSTDLDTIFNTLIKNVDSRRNLLRPIFSHMGVGVAQDRTGDVYVAMLFLQINGELSNPFPTELNNVTRIRADFSHSKLRIVGWSMETAESEIIDRGLGRRIITKTEFKKDAFLTVKAKRGDTHYLLLGPAVSLK